LPAAVRAYADERDMKRRMKERFGNNSDHGLGHDDNLRGRIRPGLFNMYVT